VGGGFALTGDAAGVTYYPIAEAQAYAEERLPGGAVAIAEAAAAAAAAEATPAPPPTPGPDGAVPAAETEAPPTPSPTPPQPQRLQDGGSRMWTLASRMAEHGGRLYFTSQVGFFSADAAFTEATFVCADGPESGGKFVIAAAGTGSGGTGAATVYYQKTGVDGTSGVFSMDLSGGARRALVEEPVLDFDTDGETLYYIPLSDQKLHQLPLAGGGAADGAVDGGGTADDMVDGGDDSGALSAAPAPASDPPTADFVAVGEGGAVLIRDAGDNGRLCRVDPATLAPTPLTEGGAGKPALAGGAAYFVPWDDGSSVLSVPTG
jgi:hypothetical protein